MIMKTRKLFLSLCAMWLVVSTVWAARVDTLQVESVKMNSKKIETVVIVPDKALRGELCPVLFLLHGYSGNAHTWLSIKPELPEMADRDGVIVVCPDGENSWYWDSPLHADSQFETFVSSELVGYIQDHYPAIDNRKARAITGLSMGGHGGMWLSIRHKDVFGAAGSMSGGVDIRPFPNSWEMKKQLGEQAEHPERWSSHTAINQLSKLQKGELALIIDCGIDDFFLKVNQRFHEALVAKGIDHDFIVRPGAHNQIYWNNAIDYQWIFFTKYFKGL